jgi:hypothetical protein
MLARALTSLDSRRDLDRQRRVRGRWLSIQAKSRAQAAAQGSRYHLQDEKNADEGTAGVPSERVPAWGCPMESAGTAASSGNSARSMERSQLWIAIATAGRHSSTWGELSRGELRGSAGRPAARPSPRSACVAAQARTAEADVSTTMWNTRECDVSGAPPPRLGRVAAGDRTAPGAGRTALHTAQTQARRQRRPRSAEAHYHQP